MRPWGKVALGPISNSTRYGYKSLADDTGRNNNDHNNIITQRGQSVKSLIQGQSKLFLIAYKPDSRLLYVTQGHCI